MPLSVRELFLIVRARDEATNTLRRVGQSISRLQSVSEIRTGLAEAEATGAALAAKRAGIESSLASNMNSQYLAKQRISMLDRTLVGIGNAKNAVEARGQALMEEQLGLQERLNILEERRRTMAGSVGALNMPMATSKELNQIPVLQNKIRGLQAAIDSAIASYNGLSATEEKVIAEREGEITTLQELRGEYAALEKQMGDLIAEEQALAERTAMLNAQLRAQKFDNFNRGAHAVGNLGRTMQYLGAISVAALGFAAHSAANLETSTRLAATQVANTTAGVARQGAKNFDFILQQMRKFPAAASDMSASLYDIFSTLDVTGNQGRKVLEQVNKAAVAGQISVKDATAGVLSVINNFKLSWRDVPQILNRSFAAVRFGRMTMDEFQNSLATTAPAAKNAQQSFDTLAGTVAFLSRALGPAKAATGFARLTEVLGNQKFLDKMKQMGVVLKDANGRFLPLNVQIQHLIDRFPYLTQGGSKALNFFKEMSGQTGTIQARRAFATIVTNMDGYRDILGKTINDNKEFSKSYQSLARSAAVQWGVFLNTLKSVAITIGAAVLPTFVSLVHPLQEVADAFNNLDKGTQKTIGRWLAIAAIGVTIVGTILSMGAGLALVGSQLAALSGAATPFLGFVKIIPIVGGLAIIAVQIYKNWSTLEPLFADIAGALKEMYDVGAAIWDSIPGPIKEVAADLLAIYAASRLLVAAWAAMRISVLVTGFTSFAAALTGVAAAEGEAAVGAEALVAALGGWEVLAVAGAIAAVIVAFKLLGSTSNRTQQDIDKLNSALTKGSQAGKDYASQSNTLDTLNRAIEDTKRSMQGLSHSSGDYQSQLSTLNDLELQRAAALRDTVKAMNELKAAQSDASSALADLNKTGAFNPTIHGQSVADARANLARLQANPIQSAPIQSSEQVLKDQLQTFNDTEAVLSRSITTYKEWLAEGINPASKGMKDMKAQILAAMDTLKTSDPAAAFKDLVRFTPIIQQFTKALGVSPNQQQTAYLNSIPKQLQSAMLQYTELTGTIAKRPIANILFKHQDAAKAVATYIATTKNAIGSKKFNIDLNKIIRVPQGAQNALANYIKKNLKLPKDLKAFINVALRGQDKAKRDARKVARDIAKQQNIVRLGHIEHGTQADFGPATGATKSIQKAEAELRKLNNKKVTINAQVKPANPWKPFTQTAKAKGAITDVMDQLSTSATATGTSAGQGFKTAFEAEIQNLSATGTITMNVYKKEFKVGSPSKRFADEIGKPAAQGMIMGFVKEAQGGKTKADINSAIKTIGDAMMSAWSDIHDTMQSNFGELFTGTVIQSKIDWGEKLNIHDLTKDLASQRKAFNTFRKDLSRLGRRGAPIELIQQLQQLGPAANNELQALVHASRPQLRRYYRLFEESQRNINKASRNAFGVQKREWMEHGRGMAVGILLGLKSEQPALERYFKHLAEVLVKGLKKHNKSHSPSMVYFEEGRNMMLGLQAGMDSVSLGMRKRAGGRVYGKNAGGNTYNINVTANKDESFHTTMRKLEFRLRNT